MNRYIRFTIVSTIIFTGINLPLCLLLSEILDFYGLNTSEPTLINYSIKEKIIVAGIVAPFFETLLTQSLLINIFAILLEKFKVDLSKYWIICLVGLIFSIAHYNGTFELCFYTLFGGIYFSWLYFNIMQQKGNKIALFATSFSHSFWNLFLILLSYFTNLEF